MNLEHSSTCLATHEHSTSGDNLVLLLKDIADQVYTRAKAGDPTCSDIINTVFNKEENQ